VKRRHLEALTSGRSEAQSVKEWAGKRVTAAFLSAHVEYKAHYFEALGRYCAGAAALERSIANTDENDCAIALAELALSVKKHGEAIATAKSFVAAAPARLLRARPDAGTPRVAGPGQTSKTQYHHSTTAVAP
jgi:lipopolysaccharide biosynthesis regulator YciM